MHLAINMDVDIALMRKRNNGNEVGPSSIMLSGSKSVLASGLVSNTFVSNSISTMGTANEAETLAE